MRPFAMILAALIVGAGSVHGSGGQELIREFAPRVLKEVKPHYPEAVRAAGIEGTVWMECTVREDGTVGDARVIRSLHPDLDFEALRALAEWRFKPAIKDGMPVAKRVEVEVTFSLREPPPLPKGPPLGSPEVSMPGNGVSTPVVLSDRKPTYPPAAMRARVQGRVKLECVVLPDGTVGDVGVIERLNLYLDDEAVRALREWRFKPGMKDGVAVPVRVEVEMTFTLRDGPRPSGDKR